MSKELSFEMSVNYTIEYLKKRLLIIFGSAGKSSLDSQAHLLREVCMKEREREREGKRTRECEYYWARERERERERERRVEREKEGKREGVCA